MAGDDNVKEMDEELLSPMVDNSRLVEHKREVEAVAEPEGEKQ